MINIAVSCQNKIKLHDNKRVKFVKKRDIQRVT